MQGINKLELLGRLGKDPELKKTSGGTPVVDVVLVVNSYAGKDENGQVKEKTAYVNANAFGSKAEYIARGKKGSRFYCDGRLENNNYKTETKEVYGHVLNIDNFILIDYEKNN